MLTFKGTTTHYLLSAQGLPVLDVCQPSILLHLLASVLVWVLIVILSDSLLHTGAGEDAAAITERAM